MTSGAGPSLLLRLRVRRGVVNSVCRSGLAALLLFTAAAFSATPLACANASQPRSQALSTRIALDISRENFRDTLNASLLQQFYGKRAFAPVWMNDVRDADLAEQTLLSARSEGLDPEDYHADEVAGLSRGTGEEQVRRELLITDGLLKYAHDVRLGRVGPDEVDSDVDLPVQRFDAGAALESALTSGTLKQFLADLPPPHPEYAALREALKHYRGLAAQGGWLRTTAKSADLEAGLQAQQDLWTRLRTETSALGAQSQQNGEHALTQAITRFQTRNGLAADGKLGTRTLDALNVSAQERAEQIAANMERWRWLPRVFEPDYIEVNVPDASLIAVHEGKIVLTSRLVVGRPSDPTPILKTMVTGVTVNPPWVVPMAIARNEYLPKLRKDPGYLARHHMSIDGRHDDPSGTTIAWSQVSRSNFTYHLRQAPGPDNALGRIKLELPNRFSVYLHDTPNTNLFANNDRDLSHGCMRVDRILALASFALSGNPETETGELKELIDGGKTQTVPIAKPLPVYVLYWTAYTNGAGEMQFRRDVYGRDGRLISALNGHSAGQQLAKDVGCPLNAG